MRRAKRKGVWGPDGKLIAYIAAKGLQRYPAVKPIGDIHVRNQGLKQIMREGGQVDVKDMFIRNVNYMFSEYGDNTLQMNRRLKADGNGFRMSPSFLSMLKTGKRLVFSTVLLTFFSWYFKKYHVVVIEPYEWIAYDFELSGQFKNLLKEGKKRK